MQTVKTEILQTAEERQAWLEAWRLLGEPERIVFLDIETTGFSRLYDSVYLVGLVAVQNGRFAAWQLLAGSLSEEIQALRKALDQLRHYEICVTYNGDMFDLPFLEERAKRLHIWTEEDKRWRERLRSADLLRQYRKHQSFFQWPNMKLKTLESFLGVSRQDPFDGGQLIEVFYEYARTQDERLEKVLLLHNYEDILHLPLLLKVRKFMEELQQGHAEEAAYQQGRLQVLWDRPFSLSHQAKMALLRKKRKEPDCPRAQFCFEAGSRQFQIALPACQEAVFYYLPGAKDYYYIPARNEIVHQSLAFDVPANQRRKAKPAECALPGQGSFVQGLPAEEGLRCYQTQYRDAAVYLQEQELAEWLSSRKADQIDRWIRQFIELL